MPGQMTRGVPRQVMEDRIVGGTDATPESCVHRASSPGLCNLLRMFEKTVGINHLTTVWGAR